jgi:hypothetical protein
MHKFSSVKSLLTLAIPKLSQITVDVRGNAGYHILTNGFWGNRDVITFLRVIIGIYFQYNLKRNNFNVDKTIPFMLHKRSTHL